MSSVFPLFSVLLRSGNEALLPGFVLENEQASSYLAQQFLLQVIFTSISAPALRHNPQSRFLLSITQCMAGDTFPIEFTIQMLGSA